MNGRSLYERVVAASLWVAAFSFACGVFLCLTLLFPLFPPTPAVAVGLVTIQRYSKLRDYAGVALFLTLVPVLTVWFRHRGAGILAGIERDFAWRGRTPRRASVGLLFTLPFVLSPLLFLTTGKFGWVLFLPVALAWAGPRALLFVDQRLWFRRVFRKEMHPYHALLFAEALAWIVYRYIAAARRIGHIPTLFLEIVFVVLFGALFWAAAILASRLAELHFGRSIDETFRRITSGAIVLLALPLIAIVIVPTTHATAIMIGVVLVAVWLAARMRAPLAPATAWGLAAYALIPLLLFSVSYASTAHLSQWIDLFHRGESIGPASDYLRGKVPYRGVFALHGMLQDGLLDAWLMELFGRSLEVSIARDALLGSLLGVSIWYLGIVIFRSIPLALLVVGMGAWTTAENSRTFFSVAAVALFWLALVRRRQWAAVLSGALAGIALFFSYEIGMYTIGGALAASIALLFVSRRVEWPGLQPLRAAIGFLLGVLLGCAPFVVYLASRNALGDFAQVSFVGIPNIIDAVWSLPFPDLVTMFRRDLNLHTLADFVLWEKFHLILSPLTIAIAAVYYLQRVIRKRTDMLDHALMVLTAFAAIAQRTAFGRAEFRHQYFAAFLVGPLLILLALLAARALRTVWQEGEEGTRAFVTTISLAALMIAGVLFWIPDLVDARINDLVNYQRRVLRVAHDPHADEVAQRIHEVSNAIHDLVPRRNDPIFDFSNQPAFYFFADRPNPTRFYQVPIASPRVYEEEVITALQATRPRVVIRTSPESFDEFDGISNTLRAPAIASYLDDTYRFDRVIRGVELWTRRTDARPAPMSSYLRRIHVPIESEVLSSARERMLFPLIGSVEGASGAYWMSDLTLHNPFRESIPVSLRFAGAGTRIDRQIRLAPRQTLRLPDLIRTFFGLPGGGIGTLWLEYRSGRAPVAVAITSDVVHGGRASVESPLTMRDAATAGAASSELTIVGIPGGAASQRRINIGVVNTGTIPATFRLTARTRNGEVIGHAVESGVAESEAWLVSNAESELGTLIDDTTTLRISVVAGSGVAYASIVDPGGSTDFIPAVPAQQ